MIHHTSNWTNITTQTQTGGPWPRFRCPRWENDDNVVTPSSVRKLIDWCDIASDNIIEVDYSGRIIPLGGRCPACNVRVGGMLPVSSDSCHNCGHHIAERANDRRSVQPD